MIHKQSEDTLSDDNWIVSSLETELYWWIFFRLAHSGGGFTSPIDIHIPIMSITPRNCNRITHHSEMI